MSASTSGLVICIVMGGASPGWSSSPTTTPPPYPTSLPGVNLANQNDLVCPPIEKRRTDCSSQAFTGPRGHHPFTAEQLTRRLGFMPRGRQAVRPGLCRVITITRQHQTQVYFRVTIEREALWKRTPRP